MSTMESKTPNDASPSYLENGLTEEEKETMSMAEESVDSNSTLSDSASIHSIGNQTNELSPGRLMVAIPALSLALFVSFIDTTSVSTSIPSISSDLNTGTSTAWIGSSFLVANTSFQLINGRISDIFGRKNCLLLSLVLLAIGDVGCGCAQSKEMLYAFRALAGIGGGGINSLAMIITSDITTLENRGKFQGIFGAVIALANGTGPFIGGALVDSVSWRWLFWIIPMLTLPAFLLILFFLPLKYTSSDTSSKLRKIDYIGIVLNIAAVLLILIPLSSGGVQYAWDSAIVITMLVIGVATAVLFILYEWKIAPMPILPVHLVSNPHCPALYIQNFFTGICYFGNFFYTPIYFQSVRGYSALTSGALLLVIIIPTGFTSILSGQMMTRTGRYRWVMVVGFVLWTLGTSLKCAFDRETEVWYAVLVLAVEGLGIGMTQQPPLLAILSNSSQSERAVATGLRYFIRTVGGAFGIIISGAILSNNLESQLSGLDFITPEILKTLTYSTYSLNKLGFTYTQKDEVLASYMTGMKYIFILFAACSGLNLLLCAGIGNTDLKAKKFMVEEKDKDMVSIRNVTPEPFQEPTQKDEESWEEKVNKE